MGFVKKSAFLMLLSLQISSVLSNCSSSSSTRPRSKLCCTQGSIGAGYCLDIWPTCGTTTNASASPGSVRCSTHIDCPGSEFCYTRGAVYCSPFSATTKKPTNCSNHFDCPVLEFCCTQGSGVGYCSKTFRCKTTTTTTTTTTKPKSANCSKHFDCPGLELCCTQGSGVGYCSEAFRCKTYTLSIRCSSARDCAENELCYNRGTSSSYCLRISTTTKEPVSVRCSSSLPCPGPQSCCSSRNFSSYCSTGPCRKILHERPPFESFSTNDLDVIIILCFVIGALAIVGFGVRKYYRPRTVTGNIRPQVNIPRNLRQNPGFEQQESYSMAEINDQAVPDTPATPQPPYNPTWYGTHSIQEV